jgi:hypothetical protein
METRPTAAEYRAVLPGIGILGLIQMVQWAVDSPTLHLWSKGLFWAALIALLVAATYGCFKFFRHWGIRAIGPGIIVIAYGLAAFGKQPIPLLVTLAVGFVASAYFTSPHREQPAPEASVTVAAPSPPTGNLPAYPASQTVNPAETYFSRKIMRLSDMIFSSNYVVQDKVFEDCYIFGPVLVFNIEGLRLDHCSIDGTPESITVEVADNRHVVGIIGVRNVTFRRCTLLGVGLIGPREQMENARRALAELG